MKRLSRIKLYRNSHPFRLLALLIWIGGPLFLITHDFIESFLHNFLKDLAATACFLIVLILDICLLIYILNDVFSYLIININQKSIVVRTVLIIPYKQKRFNREAAIFFKVIHIEPRNSAYYLAQALEIRAGNRLVLKKENSEHQLVKDIDVRRSKENILLLNRVLKVKVEV
ncbi:hypothetical protein GC194_09450 [bacterium]|nr:hypothetical protein [bacterium]